MKEPMKAERGDLTTLYERLKSFDTAMFSTIGANGLIHARPMMTQEREADADLWFVTSRATLKIDELEANPSVGITYFRDSDKAYVSIAGRAKVTDDQVRIRQLWKESWRAWFPDGPEQSDIVLIKVEVVEAEYWQPEGGTLRVMFEQARAALTGEHPELNAPEHVEAEHGGRWVI